MARWPAPARSPPAAAAPRNSDWDIPRAGGAERPHASGVAAPGRGWLMSRLRTTTTLGGWGSGFQSAGEATLASRVGSGKALESPRLNARLGEVLFDATCRKRRQRYWRRTALFLGPAEAEAMSGAASPASGKTNGPTAIWQL